MRLGSRLSKFGSSYLMEWATERAVYSCGCSSNSPVIGIETMTVGISTSSSIFRKMSELMAILEPVEIKMTSAFFEDSLITYPYLAHLFLAYDSRGFGSPYLLKVIKYGVEVAFIEIFQHSAFSIHSLARPHGIKVRNGSEIGHVLDRMMSWYILSKADRVMSYNVERQINSSLWDLSLVKSHSVHDGSYHLLSLIQ